MEHRSRLYALFSVLMLLSMSISASVYSIEPMKINAIISGGNTLYVGGDGANNYTSIRDAIKNASSGDTIIVFGGVYREHISINKKLTIIGREKNGELPHLLCPFNQFSQSMVYITGDNCVFSKFIIDGEGKAYKGMWIKGDKVTISNNIIENTEIGIDIEYSRNNLIEYNTISNSSFCSMFISSPYNLITNNHFYNNFRGVFLESSNNVVRNNTFLMDGIFTYGKQTIENNTVNGKPLRYYYNESKISIPEDTGEVILVKCHNVSVKGIDFSNASSDVVIAYSSDIYLTKNKFLRGAIEVHVFASRDVIIENNLFKEGWKACEIWSSNANFMNNKVVNMSYEGIEVIADGCNIAHNVIKNVEKESGIQVSRRNNSVMYNMISGCSEGILAGYGDTSECRISYNIVYSNERGIELIGDYRFSQEDNLVTWNIIYNNSGDGIHIYLTTNSSISHNVIQRNGKGIFVFDSYGIEIKKNNIVNNNVDATFKLYNRGYPSNTWDGNFWTKWYSKSEKPIYGTIDENENVTYDKNPRIFPFIMPYLLPFLAILFPFFP